MYLELDKRAGRLILTTSNGAYSTNIIYLDEEVYTNLVTIVTAWGKELTNAD